MAIANGKLTYQRYKEIFCGPDWEALAKKGAQTQRVLWASTSTKDPTYSDVLYVEELIGPDTVNTIPPQTLDAFRDHGKPKASLEAGSGCRSRHHGNAGQAGISMKKVTDDLVTQAVKLFAEPFDKLLIRWMPNASLSRRPKWMRKPTRCPTDSTRNFQEAIDDWKMAGKVRRLWARDASLWTGSDEGKWLGWLGITEDQLAHKQHLDRRGQRCEGGRFQARAAARHGRIQPVSRSSEDDLRQDRRLPGNVRAGFHRPRAGEGVREQDRHWRTRCFIVSSKSGSTLEPNIFKQYFFERVKQVVGAEKAGSRFIAITDPGSKFEQVAQADGFRHIFHGVPSIGGRYSALSDFGMVPAAVMGIDALRFLDRADVMAIACSSCLPVDKNPGAQLGLILGVAAPRRPR